MTKSCPLCDSELIQISFKQRSYKRLYDVFSCEKTIICDPKLVVLSNGKWDKISHYLYFDSKNKFSYDSWLTAEGFFYDEKFMVWHNTYPDKTELDIYDISSEELLYNEKNTSKIFFNSRESIENFLILR